MTTILLGIVAVLMALWFLIVLVGRVLVRAYCRWVGDPRGRH